MTSKEYLEQAYQIDYRIQSKLVQVENLRSLTTKVTTAYGDSPNNSNSDCQRLEKTIAKIIDLENDINKDIDRLVDLKKEISETISNIPDLKDRTILEMRYLSFRTWEEIAVALSLDLRWIHRLHRKALQKIKIDH